MLGSLQRGFFGYCLTMLTARDSSPSSVSTLQPDIMHRGRVDSIHEATLDIAFLRKTWSSSVGSISWARNKTLQKAPRRFDYACYAHEDTNSPRTVDELAVDTSLKRTARKSSTLLCEKHVALHPVQAQE